ncbi:MAG: TIGR00730 family Rossman fold protein [Elusimicrobia bacterium]|nr:TIGR00730 family Rossman fold protein [Elusimicrobiota bacterium]
MKTVCVYCGSSAGKSEKYKIAAVELGKEIAKRKLTLVYGGGNIGLMGVLADSVMKNGGKVTGVIPKNLFKRELAKKDITKLIVAKDMHERKAIMANLSDAFIALPGGIGTLEEFSEAVTWNQLKIHQKPCGLLNVKGYFNNFINFLNHSIKEDFFKKSEKFLIIIEKDPEILIKKLKKFKKIKKVKNWKEILEY